MPRTTVLTKEVILNAAIEIVRKEGFGALSARSVAKRLGCSVRPAYDAFGSMDVLKQEVAAKTLEEMENMICGYRKTGRPFFDFGLGYVYTVHAESVLFRSFHAESMLEQKIEDLIPNDRIIQVLRQELNKADVQEDQLEEIAVNVRIYMYGLASFIASGTLVYNEEEIMQRFTGIWGDIVRGLENAGKP